MGMCTGDRRAMVIDVLFSIDLSKQHNAFSFENPRRRMSKNVKNFKFNAIKTEKAPQLHGADV